MNQMFSILSNRTGSIGPPLAPINLAVELAPLPERIIEHSELRSFRQRRGQNKGDVAANIVLGTMPLAVSRHFSHWLNLLVE